MDIDPGAAGAAGQGPRFGEAGGLRDGIRRGWAPGSPLFPGPSRTLAHLASSLSRDFWNGSFAIFIANRTARGRGIPTPAPMPSPTDTHEAPWGIAGATRGVGSSENGFAAGAKGENLPRAMAAPHRWCRNVSRRLYSTSQGGAENSSTHGRILCPPPRRGNVIGPETWQAGQVTFKTDRRPIGGHPIRPARTRFAARPRHKPF